MEARQQSKLSLLSLVNPRRSEGYFSTLTTNDHEYFGGVCEAYGTKFRSEFLATFQHTFIRTASKKELAVLRTAIAARKAGASEGRKKGRPLGINNRELLSKAASIAWRKYVEHQTWRQIAKAPGLNQGEANAYVRTMKRQLQTLSQYLWEGVGRHKFIKIVSNKPFVREMLQQETGLPFIAHPKECIAIALKLAQLTPKKPKKR